MTGQSKRRRPPDVEGARRQPAQRTTVTPEEPAVPLAAMPFLWPLHVASTMTDSTSAIVKWYSGLWAGAIDNGELPPEPDWTTPNRVMLELPTMRLRDFSTGPNGQPTLICAPYALHGATIADFAPRHSLVETLKRAGLARVLVTDWLSATPDMQYFSIDTYLADLNVAVDELQAPVDLIGLCQGGWMALVFAARFPEKVRRLVLVGTPIDVRAASSDLMRKVDKLPLGVFENLVRLGDGRVLGRYALQLWGSASTVNEPERVLQLSEGRHDIRCRLAEWHAWAVNLPGNYYLQVVERLFKQNQIAEGRFVALGRVIDIRTVRVPMYLLAASDDEVTSPEQLFAVARLAITPKNCIEKELVPGGHLGLFMGAETLAAAWPRIAHWLSRDLSMALAS